MERDFNVVEKIDNNILSELEDQRQTLMKKISKLKIITIILGILGGIQLIISFFGNFMVVFLGIVLIIMAVSIWGHAQNEKKKLSLSFKEKIVKTLIESFYKESLYNPQSMIQPNYYQNFPYMIKRPDRVTGEDYFEGKIDDIYFRTSEVTLLERRVTSNGRQKTVTYVPYFSGKIYAYTLPKNLNTQIVVREKPVYLVSGANKMMMKTETESIEFNKKFDSLTTNELNFFKVVTPRLIRNMLQVESHLRGKIGFQFAGNEVVVYVNDNHDHFKFDCNKPITKEIIKDMEYSIIGPLAMLDALNLDEINI